jgi:hypothetical protein
MAPTPAFRVSKNSATDKKMTTIKHDAFVSSFESFSEPFTSKTGTEDVSMEIDHASESQITNTIVPPTIRGGSLFLEFLHLDARNSIYDALVNSDHEVIINPTSKYQGPTSALSSTCRQTNNELKQWATGRTDLTFNPTFGLLNLPLSTFRISWSTIRSYRDTKFLEKYQRYYTPEAAEMHLPQLELWQRAMSISKSCTEVDINDQVSKNPSLQTIGTAPKLQRSFRSRQGTRLLSFNNHYNHCKHDAKDFIVLDPKKFKGEEESPDYLKLSYFGNPYVWSKDWKNHEVEQEYAFRHPDEGGVWAKGSEAAGWAPILNEWGWEKTFGYEQSAKFIHHEQGDGTVKKILSYKWTKVENLKEKSWKDVGEMITVRLRGGQGMDVDSDSYDSDMELDQHAKDEDEDEDMMIEDECEEEMAFDNVVVLGSNEKMDIDINEEDENMEDPRQPTTVVTLSEATARRAVNRSISLLDED